MSWITLVAVIAIFIALSQVEDRPWFRRLFSRGWMRYAATAAVGIEWVWYPPQGTAAKVLLSLGVLGFAWLYWHVGRDRRKSR